MAYVIQHQYSPGRTDGRSVAVALVAEDGGFGAVKHLPPSQLAERLRERGIVDAALVSLARVVAGGPDAIERLEAIRSRGMGGLTIGEPLSTDLGGAPDTVLSALFHALVARPTSRRSGRTKGEVLDRTVATFRRVGAPVRVGKYVGDFLMDAVVEPADRPELVVLAQSFEGFRKNWGPVEHEAGHFLYAVERMQRKGVCVLQPPVRGDETAMAAFARVSRWCSDSGVEVASTPNLAALAARFGSPEQLPMFMAM